MAGSGMFSASIADFVGKVGAQNKTICRKTAIDVFTAIIEATPVDKGMTRNNWLPSTGSPADGKPDIEGKGGNAAINAVKAKIGGWEPEKSDAFLTNNSIVAVVLEYGLYPNPPKRGSYLRRGESKRGRVGPGYFRFSVDGFSEMAVGGMVGLTIAKKKGAL